MNKINSFVTFTLFAALTLFSTACSVPATAPAPTQSPTEAMMPHDTPTAEAMMPHDTPTAEVMMPHDTPTAEAMMPHDTPTVEAMMHITPTEEAMMMHYAWQQLTPQNAPPPRYDHTLAFDSDNQRIVIFGGRDSSKTLGDTWLYDLKSNTWREVKTEGPPARFGHGAIYDPARKAVVIFGGQAKSLFNDTWAFDTVKETWNEIKTTGPKPDVRYGIGATFDSANERLLISHGFATDGRHDDTWALDLKSNTWQNITPDGDRPLKRCLLETAYAPSSDLMYLFGGCSSGFGPCPQGDFWTLDLKSDKWTQINPTGDAPTARQNPALVWDDKSNQAILFGGNGSGPLNDLWVFDPSQDVWTKINIDGPTARNSHDAIYDSINHRIYLFGGSTADGPANDLWKLEM